MPLKVAQAVQWLLKTAGGYRKPVAVIGGDTLFCTNTHYAVLYRPGEDGVLHAGGKPRFLDESEFELLLESARIYHRRDVDLSSVKDYDGVAVDPSKVFPKVETASVAAFDPEYLSALAQFAKKAGVTRFVLCVPKGCKMGTGVPTFFKGEADDGQILVALMPMTGEYTVTIDDKGNPSHEK